MANEQGTLGAGSAAEASVSGAIHPVNIPLALCTAALPGLTFAAAWFAAPGWNFALTATVLAAFLLVLGLARSGTPLGVLINERNMMSLSQTQTALWTVVALAGYLTLVVARIKEGKLDAVDVAIPEELWMLMGISTTSLLGTPLILGRKKPLEPGDKALRACADQLGEDIRDIQATRQGALYANPHIMNARISDMFHGEEIGNAAHIDLAKVQMFYFTLIAVTVYTVAVFVGVKAGRVDSLPAFSQGMLALLGISHGGYLVSKMGDRSNSKPA